MNFSAVTMLIGYVSASVGALVVSVKVACALGSESVAAFGGNFFG